MNDNLKYLRNENDQEGKAEIAEEDAKKASIEEAEQEDILSNSNISNLDKSKDQ